MDSERSAAGPGEARTAEQDTHPHSINFSIGRDSRDAHPKYHEAESFDEFERIVLKGPHPPRKGMKYVASAFGGDGRRSKENALPRAWVTFDFDMIADGETQAALYLFLSRWRGFAYTTASHTPEKPRARAILEASRPMDRDECVRVATALQARITAHLGAGAVTFDTSVYRGEQPCYTPCEGAEIVRWQDSDPVDVDELLKESPEIQDRPGKRERLEGIAAADPVIRKLDALGMVKSQRTDGGYNVVCPCESEHTTESGESSTVYMLPMTGGVKYGRFVCLHDHCRGRDNSEFLEALGLDPSEVYREQWQPGSTAAAGFAERFRESAKRQPEADSVISAAALSRIEFPPLRWVIPGILPEGVTLLAGAPKTGKSWLALELVLAVGAGGTVLGKVDVEPGGALYLALEDNRRRLKRRVLSLTKQPPEAAHLVTSWPRISDGGADQIDEYLTEHPDARLIVIDTLAKFRPPSNAKKGAYEQDYAACEPLLGIAAAHRCAILIVTHTRKMEADDPLDLVSGTLGLTGGVDNVLVLKRNRATQAAELHVTGRDIEDEQMYALTKSSDNRWVITGAGAESLLHPARAAVLEVVKKHGPISGRDATSVLYPGTHITRDSKEWRTTRKHLSALEDQGLIAKDGGDYVYVQSESNKYSSTESTWSTQSTQSTFRLEMWSCGTGQGKDEFHNSDIETNGLDECGTRGPRGPHITENADFVEVRI